VRHPDRANRVALGGFGLALAAAALYGLARSFGVFGHMQASAPLLVERVRLYVGRNRYWYWPVAFVAALGVAYVGYRVLRAQLASGTRPHAMRYDEDGDEVVIMPSVLGTAVAEDLERDAIVVHARARLTSVGELPMIELDVTLREDAEIDALRDRIDDYTLDRARGALEADAIRSDVLVAFGEPRGRSLA
jgi:hypothetical protein